MGTIVNTAIGEHLKQLRIQAEYTLREVSDHVGVSHSYLSMVENGVIVQPSPLNLRKLAHFYQVSFDSLLEKAGYYQEKPEIVIVQTPMRFKNEEKLTREQRRLIQGIINEMIHRTKE